MTYITSWYVKMIKIRKFGKNVKERRCLLHAYKFILSVGFYLLQFGNVILQNETISVRDVLDSLFVKMRCYGTVCQYKFGE
jgi:hypothetical protein